MHISMASGPSETVIKRDTGTKHGKLSNEGLQKVKGRDVFKEHAEQVTAVRYKPTESRERKMKMHV